MANIKFTEFPSATVVGSMDIIPIVQDGANKKTTASVFQTYIGTLFVNLSGTQTITGSKTFSSPLISNVADGTAPFSVASTTKVTNLNADLLDGLSSAAFQTVLTNPITGTGTTNYLPKFTGTSTLGNSQLFDNGTNVGIGTASPFGGAKLQIKTSTDINIAFQNGTLDATGVKINAYNDAASLNIPMELNGSILYFKTGETERMRITSAGNVLIGTTTDAGYKLDVSGTARVSGATILEKASSSAAMLTLNATSGDYTQLYFNNAGTTKASIYWDNALNTFNYYSVNTHNFTGAATFSSSITAANLINITGNDSQVVIGSDKGGGASLKYNSNGNLDITPRSGFNTIFTAGNVLIGTTTDAASSKLTIESTTQGVLVPRMTTTQINAIGSPANGLIAYNTTLATLCFYDGSGWRKVSHSAM